MLRKDTVKRVAHNLHPLRLALHIYDSPYPATPFPKMFNKAPGSYIKWFIIGKLGRSKLATGPSVVNGTTSCRPAGAPLVCGSTSPPDDLWRIVVDLSDRGTGSKKKKDNQLTHTHSRIHRVEVAFRLSPTYNESRWTRSQNRNPMMEKKETLNIGVIHFSYRGLVLDAGAFALLLYPSAEQL
ncbi:hypothetical protein GWI33_011989 [Rhynchophorus ferrugineus]|uniref:Uncharacterized protein n=1 Tax=Rhynchophorus ferrugineus TaxID=354439 RepID=A0A834IU41_RHYFE|nr:hypothetical protein GWI33_011989 [Rhynchophorus ferrugineus]